jgi:hypothetical protein
MSNKAYYFAQIALVVTMILVIVSASGFELLAVITVQAWIGSIMMLIAMLTLVNAARMFRRA